MNTCGCRIAALTRNCVDALDLFRAEIVEHFAGEPHALVFADTRLHEAIEFVVRDVYHRAGRVQQPNFVLRLEDAGILHDLLPVHNLDAFFLQCEQYRKLNHVHCEWLIEQLRSSSSIRIFLATSSARPISGAMAPRKVEIPGVNDLPQPGQYIDGAALPIRNPTRSDRRSAAGA